MCVYEVKDKNTIKSLFDGWQETLIWSCLQDCMGKAFSNDLLNPESAQIIIGDFCFFVGIPKHELVSNKPADFKSDFIIMAFQDENWGKLVEQVYGTKVKRTMRYAIKKEPDIFDKEKLKRIVEQLQKPYEVRMIDRGLYEQIQTLPWAVDLCSQFRNYTNYEAYGLGVAVLKAGELVSGASSYTVYKEGIEIEIDTRKDQRRRGLALVCGAKLILECLKRNQYPSWDAQNIHSVALAEKLGYHFDKAYPVYEITGY